MSDPVSFDDIFAVMAVASLGDEKARVVLPDDVDTDDTATRFALALNILLDDLASRGREAREARFRGLLESAPDAMVIVAPNSEIRQVNARAENLFGYPRTELSGKPVELLISIPPGFDGTELEVVGTRKNGSSFPAAVSLQPMNLPEGRLVTAAIRDISARKKIELDLKRANEQLESFSYSVAHDLRAPLRAMNGYSTLLAERWKETLDEESRGWLSRIAVNAQRMGQLIDALLSLARINRTQLRLETVDLSQVFREAVAQAALLNPRDGVTVEIQDGLTARCDPELVRVVAANLIDNAWKFTARSAAARIEVGASQRDGQSVFFVRDNGIGFDMAYAAELFQAFHRLHGPNEFPGTGIGLATVANVVHRHGGEIRAEGQPDQGATFSFSLERAPAAP
ncbi:MAG: PAS domain S-box protein [Archangiaceae bacterium]|nr:PAS domain S-box protein [Archangiaceae bacterium]